MNCKYTFIPSNLDLNKLVEETPPVNSSVTPDKIAYMIGNLYDAANDYRKKYYENGFVNLSSRRLEKQNRNYSQIINYLLETKIFQSDFYYKKNIKCQGYRISDSYASEIKKWNYTSAIFRRKLSKSLKKYYKHKDQLVKGYKFLTKWFRDDKFHFDYKIAENILEQGVLPHKSEHTGRFLYPLYYISIDRLLNEPYVFSVDSTSGRFHSPLTKLKSELRKSFTFQGKEIYSIDIKNAQPYFSQVLFDVKFWENQINKLNNAHTLLKLNNLLPSILILVKTLESAYFQDINNFTNSVNSGTFYKDFANLINQDYPELGFDEVKCKKIMFMVLFSDNRWLSPNDYIIKETGENRGNAKPKIVFKKHYPNVYNLFKKIKTRDSRHFAILLQNIESYLVIECCCRRIAIERPDCPIYTIHDSISTTDENLEYVKYVMVDEITKFIGVSPNLKVEPW